MSMTYLAAVPLLLILYVYAGYPIVLKIASLLHARKDAEIPKDADSVSYTHLTLPTKA